jgi:serralysin
MTTYYVATNGSDSGKGTSGSPWRTINKAMKANLKSGDEVVVRSGTYKEAVHISKDGITLRSEVSGGAKIVPPSNKIGVNISADHVTVKGLDVSGGTISGIVGNGVHHVKVIDNVVHDNDANGILLMKSDWINFPSQGFLRRWFGFPDNYPQQRVASQHQQIRFPHRWERDHSGRLQFDSG